MITHQIWSDSFWWLAAELALVQFGVKAFTNWKGYRTAVRGEYEEYRKWMIHSFGITLVAVGARVLVPILLLLSYLFNGLALPAGGIAYMVQEVLNVNIWAGLVLHLVVSEWIVLRSKRGR